MAEKQGIKAANLSLCGSQLGLRRFLEGGKRVNMATRSYPVNNSISRMLLDREQPNLKRRSRQGLENILTFVEVLVSPLRRQDSAPSSTKQRDGGSEHDACRCWSAQSLRQAQGIANQK